MTICKIIIRLIFSFAIVILALFLADKFNPLLYLPFVRPDVANDYCIGLYVAIMEGIGELVKYAFSYYFDSSIDVALSDKKSDVNISNTPRITTNKDGIGKMYINVDVHGNTKFLSKQRIMIYNTGQFDFQLVSTHKSISIDSDGNILICIKDLCGHQKKTKQKKQYTVMVISNTPGEIGGCNIAPEKKWSHCIVSYNHNSAEVIIGG